MKKWSVLIAVMLFIFGASAAEYPVNQPEKDKKERKINPRAKDPIGLNIYGLGPVGAGGLSLDYFATPKLNFEIGAGAQEFDAETDLGYFVGAKYHLFGKMAIGITPYVGAFAAVEYEDANLRGYNFYFPVGIQRIKKNKMAWSIEAAYQQSPGELQGDFYGGFKLGFRF